MGVEGVNLQVLRQCREQMGYSIDAAAKKVDTIAKIESGEKRPTFKQLDVLADLYNVPRWVFISEVLPKKYNFATTAPQFRRFSGASADIAAQPKVRGLVEQVRRMRELIIDLQEDAGEPLTKFTPPIDNITPTEEAATEIRKWLNVQGAIPFLEWREKLEQKGVFVFMTDKYRGWSHIEKEDKQEIFRGLAIYYATLPIIIINDSDAQKAQPFTLFHELGHLIRKESATDGWNEQNAEVERRCDKLAAAVLMPESQFLREISNVANLRGIKELAGKFKVSPYACLVRLRNLGKIGFDTYLHFEKQLKEEYERQREKLQNSDGGPPRERGTEALNQYGRIYANALFGAYRNNEISLHKLCKSFGLKRVSHVKDMEGML